MREFRVVVVTPEAVNAASSGAKTVNGPGPLNVACKFALITADSSVVKFEPETTMSVIVLVGAGVSSFSKLLKRHWN